MMQELNLTPTQTLILFFVLSLLGLLLSLSKSLIDIDLPEDTQVPKPPKNANYGAYIQAQNHYYN
ncbi:phage protein [Streptococcus pyogenes]|nr:phage protein [Streptococcus pyogenes]VHF03685.1 phage protein [Streptococcus pyogenes]